MYNVYACNVVVEYSIVQCSICNIHIQYMTTCICTCTCIHVHPILHVAMYMYVVHTCLNDQYNVHCAIYNHVHVHVMHVQYMYYV